MSARPPVAGGDPDADTVLKAAETVAGAVAAGPARIGERAADVMPENDARNTNFSQSARRMSGVSG